MRLIGRYGLPGGRLCVLGAGNSNDLDLGALARRFREVHLVDLDADGLARPVTRQGVANLPQVENHAPIDLTGLLDHLPELAPIGPDRLEDLVDHVEASSPALRLRRFDLVVSTGLLTQIFSTVVDPGSEPASLARTVVA